jgi:hypothetical protein
LLGLGWANSHTSSSTEKLINVKNNPLSCMLEQNPSIHHGLQSTGITCHYSIDFHPYRKSVSFIYQFLSIYVTHYQFNPAPSSLGDLEWRTLSTECLVIPSGDDLWFRAQSSERIN